MHKPTQSNTLVRFYSGQSMSRHITGQPLTVRVERVFYTMWGEETHNDSVEFSDGTWISYLPDYGWRYFCPTGPLLGQPVLVDEKGFSQPGYWKRFVADLAKRLGGLPRRVGTLLICFALLASCRTSEVKHHRPLRAFEDREVVRPDSTYFLTDFPKG